MPAVGEMKPIERLFERKGLPSWKLPAALAALYGGDFGLVRPGCYANFVSSLDGVVALPGAVESGHLISGEDAPDRFGATSASRCFDCHDA